VRGSLLLPPAFAPEADTIPIGGGPVVKQVLQPGGRFGCLVEENAVRGGMLVPGIGEEESKSNEGTQVAVLGEAVGARLPDEGNNARLHILARQDIVALGIVDVKLADERTGERPVAAGLDLIELLSADYHMKSRV